jgi:hypothetical protein
MRRAAVTATEKLALALLRRLVGEGREFPDALHTVRETHQLSERALARVVAAYDQGAK